MCLGRDIYNEKGKCPIRCFFQRFVLVDETEYVTSPLKFLEKPGIRAIIKVEPMPVLSCTSC